YIASFDKVIPPQVINHHIINNIDLLCKCKRKYINNKKGVEPKPLSPPIRSPSHNSKNKNNSRRKRNNDN
ncbi:TPA: hypothetical protein ACSZJ8_12155, partial [Listeria monocytogenes]